MAVWRYINSKIKGCIFLHDIHTCTCVYLIIYKIKRIRTWEHQKSNNKMNISSISSSSCFLYFLKRSCHNLYNLYIVLFQSYKCTSNESLILPVHICMYVCIMYVCTHVCTLLLRVCTTRVHTHTLLLLDFLLLCITSRYTTPTRPIQ